MRRLSEKMKSYIASDGKPTLTQKTEPNAPDLDKEGKSKPDKNEVANLAAHLWKESEGKMNNKEIHNHPEMQKLLKNGQFWTEGYVIKHIIGPAIKGERKLSKNKGKGVKSEKL